MIARPTVTDILMAIARVNAGDWFDPYDDDPLRCRPLYWACDIYDPSGARAGNGCGRSAGEAMAMAWLLLHALDAIGERPMDIGEVPFEIPAGWRFELSLPWRAKRTPSDAASDEDGAP
jgi:hypothetical protein